MSSATSTSSQTGNSSFPVKRQVTLGSWKQTTHTKQLVQCNDNAHVTKLDFQVIRYNADYPDPYPAGLRIHCSSGGGGTAWVPQTINWRTSATQGNVTTVPGVDSPEGIRDMIGSGDNYVQLLGYSTVVVGHAGGSLWQQQVQQSQVKSEFAGCKLIGVEALFVQWLDGVRLLFGCPSADLGAGSGISGCGPDSAAAAAAAAASSTTVSPLSPAPLLVGVAIGFLGSLLIGLIAWVVIRRQVGQHEQDHLPPSLPQSSPPTSPSSPPIKHILNKDPSSRQAPTPLTPPPSASPVFGHAHLVPANPPMHYHPPQGGHTMATVSTNGSFPATLSVQPPMVYFVQAQPQLQQVSVLPAAGNTLSPTDSPSLSQDNSGERHGVGSIPSSEKELILP